MQTVASGRAGSATYCAKHVLRVRRRLDLEPPLLLTGWRPLRRHARQRALLAARAACRRRRLLRHAVLGVGVEVDALVLFQHVALPLDLAPVARRNDGQVVHPAIADKAGCHSELPLLLRRPRACLTLTQWAGDAVAHLQGVSRLAGPAALHIHRPPRLDRLRRAADLAQCRTDLDALLHRRASGKGGGGGLPPAERGPGLLEHGKKLLEVTQGRALPPPPRPTPPSPRADAPTARHKTSSGEPRSPGTRDGSAARACAAR